MHFTDIVRQLRGGKTELELDDELRQLAKSVQDSNKPGSVTLTITLKPGGGSRLTASDNIGKSIPAADRESTLFFIADDGSLTRKMPGQVSLGITEDLER